MSWRRKGLNRSSKRWLSTRRSVFNLAGYRCEKCGNAARLECHHKVPMWRDPEQDPFDLNGLMSLCRGCHVRVTTIENSRGRHSPRQLEQFKQDRIAWALFRDELVTESHRGDNFFVPVSLLFSTTMFQQFMDLSI